MIKKTLKIFKLDLIQHEQKQAETYLFHKVFRLEWIDANAFLDNYAHLSRIKNPQANTNEKATWLKWMTGEETDALFWHKVRKGTRKGPCYCGCGRTASLWQGQDHYSSLEHLEAASHRWILDIDREALVVAQKYALLARKDKLRDMLEKLTIEHEAQPQHQEKNSQ